MAVLKVRDIRRMGEEELKKKLNELRLELLKEMGSVRMGRPVKSPGRIRELRRAIARIETIRREMQRKV
jgi:large subunit ribosomal protein L29